MKQYIQKTNHQVSQVNSHEEHRENKEDERKRRLNELFVEKESTTPHT